MKRIFFFILIISTVFSIQVTTVGCANIVPPTGGPRDSLPPVLVNVNPKDSTLNFKSKRIVFTFDEYIDLEDVQGNLLFTPLFENVPIIEAKLKTISVRIRDSLDPNTTYTFNFGNAIQDINEGNPFREFTYTFSTGSYIDSMEISGNVILAENGKIDSTLQVVLHTDLTDSAVANKRPRYAARLDSNGHFTFRNLPPDTFAIYAIGEAGTMRRYTSPDQLFAFADSNVVSGDSSITLYAYKEEESKTPASRTVTQSQRDGGNVNKPAEKRLRYSANLANNQQDLLTDLTLSFELPLRNLDSTKLQLSTDTTFTPVTNYTVTQDSTNKELHFVTKWREGTVYNLILDKDFAKDTTGRKLLKTDTLTFTTRKTSDYGRVNIKITNIDTAQNPVLQFVQSDKVVFAAPVKTGIFTQQLFTPGEYDLRILYDRNGNGKWDAGKFFEGKVQPELVWPTNQTITIKPAWDNQANIALPAENTGQ